MTPLGAQGRRKAEKRSVDMSIPVAEPTLSIRWEPPPPDECEENQYTFTPDGAEVRAERITVRLSHHILTGDLAEFAVVHQTSHQGKWVTVASADSCHDVDVHVHHYARSTGQRVGEPETITIISSQRDVNMGYDAAYEFIVSRWSDNRERWNHA